MSRVIEITRQSPTVLVQTPGPQGPSGATGVGVIMITLDGGGAVLTGGLKGYLRIPYACTIVAATLLADQAGSLVIDIWKDTFANYPPTNADSITGAAPPTLAAAIKSTDSTLTGWTVAVAAGDVLAFNVDSAATIQWAQLSLDLMRT